MKAKKVNKSSHTEYSIVVGFVDNTYWDDGSRYTSRRINCVSETDMKNQLAKFFETGKIQATSSQTGESGVFNIGWIREEVSTTETRSYDLD